MVTQAETLDPFAGRMGADYERYTAGTVMLETAERLVVEEKEPALQQFLLLVGALRAMCDTLLRCVGERSITAGDRSLVVVAILTWLGKDRELEFHIPAALNHGLERDEVREIMVQMCVYGGFPRAVEGMRAAQQGPSGGNIQASPSPHLIWARFVTFSAGALAGLS